MNSRGFGRANVAAASDSRFTRRRALRCWSGSNSSNSSNYRCWTRLPTSTPSSAGCRQTSNNTSNARTLPVHRSSNIPKIPAYRQRLPPLLPLPPPDVASSHETALHLLTAQFVPHGEFEHAFDGQAAVVISDRSVRMCDSDVSDHVTGTLNTCFN